MHRVYFLHIFKNLFSLFTGKQRVAHKPNSKPKLDTVLDLEEVEEEGKGVEADEEYCKILSEKELWARLDQLEKLEELQDEEDRYIHIHAYTYTTKTSFKLAPEFLLT
jgi:hypothetical protein